MSDELNIFSGLLLEWPTRQIQRDDLLRDRQLRFDCEIAGSKWERFVYTSELAFKGEDLYGAKPPFRYPIVARRSGHRILLLSLAKRIIDHMVEGKLNQVFPPYFRRVSIAVDALVKAMVSKPTVYSLTFVHARVPAFGASLRSVSFYGDDLTEAALFRDNVAVMNFFTCGLRYAAGGPELMRVGGDGSISFYMGTPKVVQEVESALRFLRAEGYLSSDIFPADRQSDPKTL